MANRHHRDENTVRAIEELQEITLDVEPTARHFAENQQYFLGQSEILQMDEGTANQQAWAGLINPAGSGVTVYINVWTISSVAQDGGVTPSPFNAVAIFDGNIPVDTELSANVTPTNVQSPKPSPNAEIRYKDGMENFDIEGIIGFTRVLSELETVVSQEDGRYILPEGSVFAFLLNNPDGTVQGKIAFGWWEVPIEIEEEGGE